MSCLAAKREEIENGERQTEPDAASGEKSENPHTYRSGLHRRVRVDSDIWPAHTPEDWMGTDTPIPRSVYSDSSFVRGGGIRLLSLRPQQIQKTAATRGGGVERTGGHRPMTRWIINYTVSGIDQSGTVTVENNSMSKGVAQRYVADHLLKTGDVAPNAFVANDIAVRYEPDID